MDRPRPLRVLRDLFVYAPVGFLLEAPRLVPELVETGRERLTGCRRPASSSDGRADRAPAGRIEPPPRQHVPRRSHRRPRCRPASSRRSPSRCSAPEDDGDEATLAIPSYDQLAASQVVARLAGLDAAELAEIEAYEQAHRARRTVLSRISQLRRT